MEVTLALGAELLVSTSGAATVEAARKQLQETIDSGAAREKFAQMVAAQGGDLDAPRVVAPDSPVTTNKAGYIAAFNAERLGQAVIAMRGGRKQLGDVLDLSTGFEMLVRLGDRVEVGQPIATLFAPASLAEEGRRLLLSAIEIAEQPPTVGPLILERIG
jgi:thymidine phosphorylase